MICPVAECGKDIPVNSRSKGFRHFQSYDPFHRQLHYNWLAYYYPDIAKGDYTDDLRFRMAYRRWHSDESKREKKPVQDNAAVSFSYRDGKVVYDGKEYTPDEFSMIMPGMKLQ